MFSGTQLTIIVVVMELTQETTTESTEIDSIDTRTNYFPNVFPIIGGSGRGEDAMDTHLTSRSNCLIFLQFLGEIGQNNRLTAPPLRFPTRSGNSWISHCWLSANILFPIMSFLEFCLEIEVLIYRRVCLVGMKQWWIQNFRGKGASKRTWKEGLRH